MSNTVDICNFQFRGVPDYSTTVNKTEEISEIGFFEYIDLLDKVHCVHEIPKYHVFREEPEPVTHYNLEFEVSVIPYNKATSFIRRPTHFPQCKSYKILYNISIRSEFRYTDNVANFEELNYYLGYGSDTEFNWVIDSPQISRPTTPVRQITRPGR